MGPAVPPQVVSGDRATLLVATRSEVPTDRAHLGPTDHEHLERTDRVDRALVHLRRLPKLSSVAVLTWGGLRGGISVALALTLEPSPYRGALLAVCYAVVVFTIIVQGLSMPMLVRRLYRTKASQPRSP